MPERSRTSHPAINPQAAHIQGPEKTLDNASNSSLQVVQPSFGHWVDVSLGLYSGRCNSPF